MEFEDFKEKETTDIILREIRDTLESGIRSVNVAEYRNTYVINVSESFDDSYPMYVNFNIMSDMSKIVSVLVSFWIQPYRAYPTTGVVEEDNSPTIKFYISENEGISYNDTFFGGYTTNQKDVDITSLLSGSGKKMIRFTSGARARLNVHIEVKLDIKAR